MIEQDREILIQLITEKVWAKLGSRVKPKSFILCESLAQLKVDWRHVLENQCTICEIDAENQELPHHTCLVIFSSLTMKQLIAIRNIQAIDSKTGLILNCLQKGIPVWINESYQIITKELAKARFGLKQEIQEMKRKLTSFGIVFMESETIFQQEIMYLQRMIRHQEIIGKRRRTL